MICTDADINFTDQQEVVNTDRIDQLLDEYQVPEEWRPTIDAYKVANVLIEDIDRPDGGAIEHAVRSLKNLATFCKDVEPECRQAMSDAMLLHDVLGRVLHEEDDDRWLLSNYLQDEVREYLQSSAGEDAFIYMHDQVTIGDYVRKHRESIERGQLNDPNYDGMLNVDAWKADIPAINGDGLQKLSKEVNIESLIIKASEMMDNIKYPPNQDSQHLRNILESESFYIPMLKALGYDAMAAEMASTCEISRLYGQGQGAVVEKAVQLYQQYASEDPASILQRALNLQEKPAVKWIVNQTSDDIKSGMNCRFAEIEVNFSGTIRRFLFRQKTIGSMAKKLHKKGEYYNLLDAFGFQVVIDGGDQSLDQIRHYEMSDDQINKIYETQVSDLAVCFNKFADTVLSNSQLELKSTNGDREPVFVQGDKDFINQIIAGLSKDVSKDDIGRIEYNRRSTPYRVAKATAMLDGKLPVEIQMITDLDRKLGRTGATSHIAYKSGDAGDNIRWIQQIHKRLEFMKNGEGNPIALKIGQVALLAMLRGLYSELFTPQKLYDNRINP
mgnify:CR=1 FL=1